MALGDSYPVELLDDQGNRVATEVAAVQFTDGADQPSRSGGGSQPLTGSGSPLGSVAATSVGQLYIDTTNGALWISSLVGTDDWISVGGLQATVLSAGVQLGESSGNQWTITDSAGAVALTAGDPSGTGTTNGRIATASNVLDDGNGGTANFAGGVIFPTSDPGVAGAWWDDAGTLTKSTG